MAWDLGVEVGDNLFGPNGYLSHVTILGSIEVLLGSGADSVFVQPNEYSALSFEGHDPPLGEPASDSIHFDFADAVGPVLTPGPDGVSTYTFDNHSDLSRF
jgi:hypothetical protein